MPFNILLTLYDRFIQQLRYGCGSKRCTTATCFSCRLRLAGSNPLRRYNPTSARILAVHLASQECPETGLCPRISRSLETQNATSNLIFSARPISPKGEESPQSPRQSRKASVARDAGSPSRSPHITHVVAVSRSPRSPDITTPSEVSRSNSPRSQQEKKVVVSEKPVNKDHRSFAAATFGTAAFKMLEWLTPQSLQSISQKVSEVVASPGSDVEASRYALTMGSTPSSPASNDTPVQSDSSVTTPSYTPQPISQAKGLPELPSLSNNKSEDETKWKRTGDSKNTSRRRSLDPQTIAAIEARNIAKALPKLPQPNAYHDKLGRRSRSDTSGVQEVTFKTPFFENVPVPPQHLEPISSDDDAAAETIVETTKDSNVTSRTRSTRTKSAPRIDTEDQPELSIDLPQSLTQLNVELVDFICNVYQEDDMCERHPATYTKVNFDYKKEQLVPQNSPKRLSRQGSRQTSISKLRWKAFHEQALFDILSDPDSLVSSFTKNGQLLDSQTLWYCMVRLTRSTPSLVLHSLWLAAGSLFIPPPAVQAKLASVRKFNGNQEALTEHQASCIMTTCLHALVALAPVIDESRMLYDMSRIRSNGAALSNLNAYPRTQLDTSMEYDDVFSDELAIRLAKRLFCAVTAQRRFAKFAKTDTEGVSKRDILDPLLDQLDLLHSGPIRVLEFTEPERLMHETRVPTLLLDWARAVLLHEWDGKPEFTSDGAFSGALSLMATLRKFYLITSSV